MAVPPPTEPPADAAAACSEALALYAAVLAGKTLRVAARRLVAAIAETHGYARASIGIRVDARTELVAVSNLEAIGGEAELPQLLRGAIDEAIDQQATIAAPAIDAESRSIGLEHALLQRKVGGAVASVPLAVDAEAIGAVCVERHGAIAAGELAALEQRLVLAAPVLLLMQRNEERWHRRARRALREWRTGLRRPERRWARRAIVGGAVALALLAALPLEHEVSGRARIEGAEQRVLVAPTDGFLKAAHVRPGDRVRAGAALADLMERDLRLERDRWASQLTQHENAYAAAMARNDRAQASISLERIAEAQSQLALVDEQLARGQITAPFDGIVIQGDLSQSIGAPVRQGDPLITVATTGRYRVIVEIDETDIARVSPGQRGVVVLSALPWDTQAIVVERITPLARAVEGRNVFEVQARLVESAGELRPGLQGRGRVVVGRLPPLWAWGRHVVDRVRLAWWAVFG